jgi:subtilase family serine protease
MFAMLRKKLSANGVRAQTRRIRPQVLQLEDRVTPSLGFAVSDLHLLPSGQPATGTTLPGGFSPAQIAHAYGFDLITFSNGTVQGNGSGQTIAIVDAYDDPNITSDLAAFDAMYGLPAPPSFTKINQTGGTSYPAGNTGWGLEISGDVEWAHGLAPAANIVLVEANSTYYGDLFAAIDTARSYPGVSVVSMSFGTNEWNGETGYDSHFTTPSGHTGVTFVAPSGDNGTASGAQYQAVSPNVLGVGGTALTLDANGNYLSETGWSGSGGGFSIYYSQPSYQKGVVTQGSTMRATPDVAFNASSASPYAVYDSYGYGGWVQAYGTSLAAPSWAALIAIADQGRALAGQGSLNGPSQTLPMLYGLPQSDFNDITTGSNGGYSAGPGYDLVTGRGTPIANLIVSGLVGQPSGSGGPTVTTPASAAPSSVTGTTTSLSVVGTEGTATLTYTWSVTSLPPGAKTPTFSVNGTSAAQNTTATFYAAGNYTFQAKISDSGGLSTTSSVTVTVNQTLTSFVVTPSTDTVSTGAGQQFTAIAKDQFGNPISSQPAVTWSLTGVGTLSGTGMYTAPGSTGTATVRATGGGMSNSASVTVVAAVTPPVAPTSLLATAISRSQINLSWLESSTNVTGFYIQRSTNGANWTQIATVSGTTLSYSDKTVSRRKTYYYRVDAYNSGGTSAWSNVVTVTTPSIGVLPSGNRSLSVSATPTAGPALVSAGSSTGAENSSGLTGRSAGQDSGPSPSPEAQNTSASAGSPTGQHSFARSEVVDFFWANFKFHDQFWEV